MDESVSKTGLSGSSFSERVLLLLHLVDFLVLLRLDSTSFGMIV
jgi:hypothetical protein